MSDWGLCPKTRWFLLSASIPLIGVIINLHLVWLLLLLLMSIGIQWLVISSSSLQLSHGFYAIFLFLFPHPTTSSLCVPLTMLPLNRARHNFNQGSPIWQLHPLLQLHPPPLPLLQWEVWLWTLSLHSFSTWISPWYTIYWVVSSQHSCRLYC